MAGEGGPTVRPTPGATANGPARPGAPPIAGATPKPRPAGPAVRRPAAAAGGGRRSSREPAKPASTARYLSLFSQRGAALPATVRVDLTTQETARSLRFPDAAEEAMSWEFFRCIAAEIGKWGRRNWCFHHLAPRRCPGRRGRPFRPAAGPPAPGQPAGRSPRPPAATRWSTRPGGGLDCLVVISTWRANTGAARPKPKRQNPGHFAARLGHPSRSATKPTARSQRRCVIKLVQTGKTLPHHALTPEIAKLAEMADNFSVEWLPDAHDLQAAGSCDGGGCLCWGPFVEANVRANGHLVVQPRHRRFVLRRRSQGNRIRRSLEQPAVSPYPAGTPGRRPAGGLCWPVPGACLAESGRAAGEALPESGKILQVQRKGRRLSPFIFVGCDDDGSNNRRQTPWPRNCARASRLGSRPWRPGGSAPVWR